MHGNWSAISELILVRPLMLLSAVGGRKERAVDTDGLRNKRVKDEKMNEKDGEGKKWERGKEGTNVGRKERRKERWK